MKYLLMSALALSIFAGTAEARRDQHREARQQGRIKQGVHSGELTRKEAKKLRKGQRRIDHMQQKANADGTVTPKERLKIEKAQDKQSDLIYKQKHDGQDRNKPMEPVEGQSAPAVEANN